MADRGGGDRGRGGFGRGSPNAKLRSYHTGASFFRARVAMRNTAREALVSRSAPEELNAFKPEESLRLCQTLPVQQRYPPGIVQPSCLEGRMSAGASRSTFEPGRY